MSFSCEWNKGKIGTDATISCGIKQLSEDPTWPQWFKCLNPPKKQTDHVLDQSTQAPHWMTVPSIRPFFGVFIFFKKKRKKKKHFNLDPYRDLWNEICASIVCSGVSAKFA